MVRFKPLFCSILLSIAANGVAAQATAADVVPLPRAHAHNDYYHTRPLLDALAHGFCSIEADVFLVDDRLLVGHARSELKPERSLVSLYLNPLRERVRRNGGRVYRDGPTVTLLIDVKSDASETYGALRAALADYAEILTTVQNGVTKPSAVTVIISGNRATDLVSRDSPRYASVDGRLTDLDADPPSHLVPLVSDNWQSHFTWRGRESISEQERSKLAAMVARAHRQQRRIRFWSTPDNAPAWTVLLESGVDLINTDDLDGLQRFLLARASGPRTANRPPLIGNRLSGRDEVDD